MRIRRAGPGDAHAIAALTRSEIERGLPHGWTAPRLARLLPHPDTNAYVLISADGGLGGFSVARFELEKGHLMLHAIAPGLRRQGLGGELLDWQLRAASTAGLRRLSLEVRVDNAHAQRFYRGQGFRVEGRLRRYYAGRDDALRMALEPLGHVSRSSPPADRGSDPG